MSTTSPLTRKAPRVKETSLRSYWMSTSRPAGNGRVRPLPRPSAPPTGRGRTPVYQAVDTGRRGTRPPHPAGQQVGRRGVAQALHVVVDGGVPLDVGVRLRDVRLGLVVVVVADEVLDGVVRQQAAQLVGELGGQRLVGAMTRVGRCCCSISQAAVADLPVPVAPIRTMSRSPRLRRSSSSLIAAGWSPAGS